MIRPPMRECALAFAIVLAATLPAEAEPRVAQFDHDDTGAGWTRAASKEGITLERRSVPGSSYYEYRSVVDVALPPERVVDEVWRGMHDGDMEALKHRDILRSGPDEMIIYDQIRTPIVSDRDYTIRVRRVVVGQRTQFRCESANELGPPPKKGLVRVPFVRAGWMTAPDGRGGTLLTYYAFSEPGGSVPPFLVRGAQQDRSLADVVRMMHRLRRLSP